MVEWSGLVKAANGGATHAFIIHGKKYMLDRNTAKLEVFLSEEQRRGNALYLL